MGARLVACANRTGLLLAVYVALVVASGSAVAALEGWPWGDGLWWAVVTTTTTGYGDLSPATVPGRVLAGLTMLAGIVAIGVTVGRIAAVVIHTRDDWTHEEQEASREREERTLAALAELAERMGPGTRVSIRNLGASMTVPDTWTTRVGADGVGWLTESQRRLGWRRADEAMPPVGMPLLVRHRDGDPDAPALRGRVDRVHGRLPQTGTYAWLLMDRDPDRPDAGRTLALAGPAWAWREDTTPTTERTTTG